MEKKKKITIEVEPATAVATVGLLRGIFPSIIEHTLERQAATNGSPLKFNKVENMQEVLDEIYEKCIAETNLREFAQAHLNSDGLPN
jgi:predicted translin family RNA/ssDNA-binding protein